MKRDIFTLIDDIDIFITNVNGRQIELSKLLVNVDIYENIFDPFLNGKIVLVDTLDIMKNFIIIGNESLDITIHTTDADRAINLSFRVYKINRDPNNFRGDVKRKVIELYFCSEETITGNKNSISKKFNGSPEAIVQTLLTDYLSSSKTLTSDSTSAEITIFSNYWKFMKIIDFASKLSQNSQFSDYIFYEDFDGFNFRSISNLINQESVNNLSFSTDTLSFIGNNNIKIFKFENYFNIFEALKSGMFGTTFFQPDDTNYAFTKYTKTLSDVYNDITTNGATKHFDDDLSSNTNLVATNFYEPSVSQKRLSALKLLQYYNLTIQLNGDFGRKCGQNVNLDFPNLDNENVINEFYNGRWFISGIRHMINQKNIYTQNVSLCKNAFFNDARLNPISTFINV